MFTHLHNHTEYSMLDGISRIPLMVRRAKELGMDSLAITDHGNLHGAIDFYTECKSQEIKPIIGCEVYVAHQSRHERSPAERSPNHLVLLAKNNEGYRNLMKLVTTANLEGMHYKPRIDWDLLTQHSSGLICLSGCPSADIPRLIVAGETEKALTRANEYRELFGEDYYLEIQDHKHVEHLDDINFVLKRMSRETGIPLVLTNDAHYTLQGEAPLQDIYICIQTNTNINDPKRLRMEDDSYYLKSPQEMAALFQDLPQAYENTGAIAEKCSVEMDFSTLHLPRYQTPDSMDADKYLAQLCWQGFERRYRHDDARARERLEYELEVIRYTKFANYFLVVWDIVNFVRKEKIMLGVRGSAAASVALYCLDITEVEPLEYNLVFERFLNYERKEMPDIDMDFQDDRRDEAMQYVIDRYGKDNVALIISFGTLGARASIRSAGRALGQSYGQVDEIARLIPAKARTIADALDKNPDLAQRRGQDREVAELLESAQGLEGIVHHVGNHPAGVLIADEPLVETVPLQRPVRSDENSSMMMTQYSMDPVAKLGLLKMDFLGLTSLTILDHTVKLIAEHRDISMEMNQVPLDDSITFELMSTGRTTDIFQLESAGMQRYIRELKPNCLGDISAMIALYRPGPMEHIDTFIKAKHGLATITYPHESLKEVLDETYGVIVYQDQVLLILQKFAGYSLGDADIVRKAMGKKIPALMAEERTKFVKGSTGQGFDEDLSNEIFNLIEPFAGYAFNKAHSISYALISYWTGYFKAHFPLEYMTSVLNAHTDSQERTARSVAECGRMGIPVLLPDINASESIFAIDGSAGRPAIRFGLGCVKNITPPAVEPITAERRENGPYKSLGDLCQRADMGALNRRSLENLARAGALDTLAPREQIEGEIDRLLSSAQASAKMRITGQQSLFGEEMNSVASEIHLPPLETKISPQQRAAWEKELLGTALSYNPLLELAAMDLDINTIANADQIDDDLMNQDITVAGVVERITLRTTKESQKQFLTTMLAMNGGGIEATVWPEALERTKDQWQEGAILQIKGRLKARNGGWSISVEEVMRLARSSSEGGTKRDKRADEKIRKDAEGQLIIHITETEDESADRDNLRRIARILCMYPGPDPPMLRIDHGEGQHTTIALDTLTVRVTDKLCQKLEEELGQEAFSLV